MNHLINSSLSFTDVLTVEAEVARFQEKNTTVSPLDDLLPRLSLAVKIDTTRNNETIILF